MKKRITKTLMVALTTFAITQLQAQTDTLKAKTTEGGQTPVAQAQDSAKIGTSASTTTPTVAAPKPANSLVISVDMRSRAEFRHGYRQIPLKDTAPSFFLSSTVGSEAWNSRDLKSRPH